MNAWRDHSGAGDPAPTYHTVIHNSGSGNQFVVGPHGRAGRSGGPASGAELSALVERLWDALPDLGLDDVDQADYLAAVGHIEEEITRARPKRTRLGRALGTVAALLRSGPAESARLALGAVSALGHLYGLAAPD
ncbi:hypothetical protein [Marinactinospora rubrisoli]|uniref:Uncharacterized protein n=1 Tax=Marinactinospora rubrisoli TaxID=2715399 RepID=A0ABW2KE01_9ACTN